MCYKKIKTINLKYFKKKSGQLIDINDYFFCSKLRDSA